MTVWSRTCYNDFLIIYDIVNFDVYLFLGDSHTLIFIASSPISANFIFDELSVACPLQEPTLF